MGAGRKTFTYDHDTRNETNYRFEEQQRNLGPQLGGVIFSEPCPAPRHEHAVPCALNMSMLCPP